MTATVQEHAEHPAHPVPPTRSSRFPLDADGFTDLDLDAHLAALRRAADQAHARELLGLADLITQLSTHPHPDQAGELSDRRIQIMGRHHGHPFAAWTPLQAAIELVALHHSRSCGVPIESALTHVWTAHTAGTAERPVWEAVAAGEVTARQARTILAQSRRLTAHTGTLTADADGEVTEGPALLEGEALTAALDRFHTTALTWAREGKVGSALHGRCFRLLERMTPHHERVVRHTRHPGREAVLTDCDDGATAHLSLELPLGLGRRLMTFATACADATTDHTRTHGLHDTRDHATRVNDALVDVLRDGLTRFTPATSDEQHQQPADAEHPVTTGRTHRPATSVHVLLRIDATTLFGTDEDNGGELPENSAWVDGLGPVSIETARELAADPDAVWRTVVTAPGTRDVIDVAADVYRPSAALRRFVVARDATCRGPGCVRPAADCDLDHVVPWPEGPTTADNLQALCRTHHRFKTQFVWEHVDDRAARVAVLRAARDADDPPPF
ncbi:HNH endonuclease signature motif containing protein [Kineococcus endophyticus]|uniref:HNH endonuclease signature motif containing protein n=1 Tax=Kineococcus endophyticus TaxID=1181883 RepID=A0ABV3PBA5_9ACTN